MQPFSNYSSTGVSNSSLATLGKTLQCVLWGSKYALYTPSVTASLTTHANSVSAFAVAAAQPITIYIAFAVQFSVPPATGGATQAAALLASYYGNLTATISASFVSGQFTNVLHQIAQQQHVTMSLGSAVAVQQAPTFTKPVVFDASTAPVKNPPPSGAPVGSSSATTSNGVTDFFSAGNMPVYILVIAIAVLLPVLLWLWCTSAGRRPDRIDLADKQLQNWTIAPVVDVPIVAKHVPATKPQKSNSVEDFYYEVSRKQAVPRNAGPLSSAHSAVVEPSDSRYNRSQKAQLNEFLKSQRDQRHEPSYRESPRDRDGYQRQKPYSSSSSNSGLSEPPQLTSGPRLLNSADADVTDPWEEEYRYKEYIQFQKWMEENPAAQENAAVDPEPWQRDEQYRKYREFQGQKEAVLTTQKILEQQLLERELQKELMKSRPPPPPPVDRSYRDHDYNPSRSQRDYPQDREDSRRGYSSRDQPRSDREYDRERQYSRRGGDERGGRGDYARETSGRDPREHSRERDQSRRR